MRTRSWLAALGATSLLLIGVLAVRPFDGVAQQNPTATASSPRDDDDHSDDDHGTPVVGTPLLRPAIDLIRAQEIAVDANSGSVVTKVELDGDDGRLTYEIELNHDTDVKIDANSGAILSTDRHGDEDDDHNGQGDDSGHNGDDNDD